MQRVLHLLEVRLHHLDRGLEGRDPGRAHLLDGGGFLEILLGHHLLGDQPFGAVGLAFLLPEVGLGLLEVGLGFFRLAFRCSIMASRSLCSMTARICSFLTFVLLDAHLLDPAGDLGSDHRLLLRLEVSLGAQELLGLAGGHPLDQADGHLGLGPDLVILLVGDRTGAADDAQRDQPEQPGEQTASRRHRDGGHRDSPIRCSSATRPSRTARSSARRARREELLAMGNLGDWGILESSTHGRW